MRCRGPSGPVSASLAIQPASTLSGPRCASIRGHAVPSPPAFLIGRHKPSDYEATGHWESSHPGRPVTTAVASERDVRPEGSCEWEVSSHATTYGSPVNAGN